MQCSGWLGPAGLVLAAACAAGPSPAPPATGSAPTAVALPPPPAGTLSPDDLAAIARRMTSLRSCTDTCCVGEIPAAYRDAWPGSADAAQAPALRAILDTPASPTVHAIAATWLSRALDVGDIARLSRCIDSEQPAGAFPVVTIPQTVHRCYPLTWQDKSLGRACIDAVGRVTSRHFATAADVHAWVRSHAAPLDSYDYWEKVLGTSHPAPAEVLERLRRHSPELYFRVAALDPDILGERSWPVFDEVARQHIGGDRILRLLGKQESFPELAAPERLAALATTVLRRADKIFEPRHGPGLLALWDQRGCCAEHHVRAALAVAVSRLVHEQARRVLVMTLTEIDHHQAPVLEELARRYRAEERTTLDSWLYGDAARRAGDEDDLATAILRGLEGASDRSVLAALLKDKTPNAAAASVVQQLVATAAVAGYAAPERCRGNLDARAGKGASPRAWERASREAMALRTECLHGVLVWIRRPNGTLDRSSP